MTATVAGETRTPTVPHPTPTGPDTGHGNLAGLLAALHDAIAELIDPIPVLLDRNQITWTPSRYQQLRQAIAGQTGERSGRTRSSTPIWCAALDQLTDIDTATQHWAPEHDNVEDRYQHLRERTWRPQDTGLVTDITAHTHKFTADIIELTDPEPAAYLQDPHQPGPAACTACGARRVHKPDPADPGKTIMQPALRVTADGCTCQRCHTTWAPGQLRLLAAALGYPLPAGVLE